MQKYHISRQKESCKYRYEDVAMRPQLAAHRTANSAIDKVKVPQDFLQVTLKEIRQSDNDSIEETNCAVAKTKEKVRVVSKASTVPSERTVVVQVRYRTVTYLAIVCTIGFPVHSTFRCS